MKWFCAVTTAYRNQPTLIHSLQTIAEAGWKHITVSMEPNSVNKVHITRQVTTAEFTFLNNDHVLGPWPHYLKLLDYAYWRDTDWEVAVIFQDDVHVARYLRDHLNTILWPEESDRIGVVSLYCPAIQHTGGHGFYQLSTADLPRRAMGALAYCFPRHSVYTILREPPGAGSRTKIDQWIGAHCKTKSLSYWLPATSFVQHTGKCSAINNIGNIHREYRYARAPIRDCRHIDKRLNASG